MNAFDLRIHSEKMFECIKTDLTKYNNPDSAAISTQLQIMSACFEIAAQLDEIKEVLRVLY